MSQTIVLHAYPLSGTFTPWSKSILVFTVIIRQITFLLLCPGADIVDIWHAGIFRWNIKKESWNKFQGDHIIKIYHQMGDKTLKA